MSSPKSATPVPPPAKKRGVWSSDDKMVLSCVKGSSASPKHTIFTVLHTVIPHVQVRKIQPPEECGLINGHKSLDSKQTIKKSLCCIQGHCQGHRDTKTKQKTMIQAIKWSMGQTDSGHFSLCSRYFLIPKKMGFTPDIGPAYSKQALKKVQNSECSRLELSLA